ncbi:hypothetical protein [Acidithiobacillus ferrooxidans]|nr:hypothetical protein [Acidithiobacillus ferrooxidans]
MRPEYAGQKITAHPHENREMGLILHGREVAQLRIQFDQDWRLAG